MKHLFLALHVRNILPRGVERISCSKLGLLFLESGQPTVNYLDVQGSYEWSHKQGTYMALITLRNRISLIHGHG